MLWHRLDKQICFIFYFSYRLSTLWHFIAYIDIPDEQANAEQKTKERDQMIAKRRAEKNQIVEQLEDEFEHDVIIFIIEY